MNFIKKLIVTIVMGGLNATAISAIVAKMLPFYYVNTAAVIKIDILIGGFFTVVIFKFTNNCFNDLDRIAEEKKNEKKTKR